MTEEERVEELGKVGAVLGPIICCIYTVKVNEVKDKAVAQMSPNVDTEALAYVDDILAVESKEDIESR